MAESQRISTFGWAYNFGPSYIVEVLLHCRRNLSNLVMLQQLFSLFIWIRRD